MNYLRLFIHKFRYTPIHPQWFAYRCERERYERTGQLAKGRVLDVGCGRQGLRKFLTSVNYISLDYPETGINLYKSRPSLFGDASKIPFKNETFDTVILLEVLEHLPDPISAIQEARRVLKKDGVLIISTPFLYPIHDSPIDFQRWTQFGLGRLISSSGFKCRNFYKMGGPIESGVLLFNLALTWATLNTPFFINIPLILSSIFFIPILNIIGFVLSFLFRISIDTPFAIGYLLVAEVQD